MRVLLPGASGRLGSAISKKLDVEGINYLPYNRTIGLDAVDWSSITHIINCAAVTPSINITFEQYWAGNVSFLEELIPYSRGKCFIHFSSLSQFYRFDDYQLTKMIGVELLTANKHIFSQLEVVVVPTLDDNELIEKIIASANNDKMPVVDCLKYCSMSILLLAGLVVSGLCDHQQFNNVVDNFVVKNLYDEVAARVSEGKIIKGNHVDRTCLTNRNLINIIDPQIFKR